MLLRARDAPRSEHDPDPCPDLEAAAAANTAAAAAATNDDIASRPGSHTQCYSCWRAVEVAKSEAVSHDVGGDDEGEETNEGLTRIRPCRPRRWRCEP